MAAPNSHDLASVFGILGTIMAFLVYLAPLPTFYRIFKKKSTDGFQSIPYSVSLFSAMLMLYYAFLKINALMLITINSIGCVIETIYLIVYMIYATPKARIYTTKLIILFNLGTYGLIIACTYQFSNGPVRLKIVGWINVVFSVCVFAAPLSILRLVIKTKSVEYMSFPLSFCLTLCAVMWFFYGLLIKDLFVASPNILGFTFGIAQMIMYLCYKNTKKAILPEFSLNETQNRIAAVDIVASDTQFKTEDIKSNIGSEAEVVNATTEPSGCICMTNNNNNSRVCDATTEPSDESIV